MVDSQVTFLHYTAAGSLCKAHIRAARTTQKGSDQRGALNSGPGMVPPHMAARRIVDRQGEIRLAGGRRKEGRRTGPQGPPEGGTFRNRGGVA
jgi:hypothetical protein